MENWAFRAVENGVISESNSIKSCLTKDIKAPTDNPAWEKLEVFEKSSFRYWRVYSVIIETWRTSPCGSQPFTH